MTVDETRRAIGFGVIGLIGVVALIVFWGPMQRFWVGRAFAEGRLREFERLALESPPPKLRNGEVPPRGSKVLLVRPGVWKVYRRGNRFSTQIGEQDQRKKVQEIDPPRVDDFFLELDGSIRASSLDEVDTVIFCEYGLQRVGTYVSDDPNDKTTFAASKKSVMLRVYDVRTRRCVGKYLLRGDDPKFSVTVYDDHAGELPDVAAFVESMPVR